RHWGLPLTPGGSDDAFVVENTVPEGTKVILAAAISGDLTGKVSTGQVFRLQVTNGVIADDVRATWPSGSPELDTDTSLSYAIEHIEAKAITGRIIAGDEIGPPANPLPVYCSIRNIRVGVGYEETTQGIRGDIYAYGGHVRNMESAGDIGTAHIPVKINAGYGLTNLTCSALVNQQTAARDVHAHIRTNYRATLTDATYDTLGWIRNIRVSGDLNGSIEANILRPFPVSGDGSPGGYEYSNPNGNSFGIFVAGDVNAAVTLRQGVLVSSMRAAQFNGPITIETYLKGEIVATSGGIVSLAVGTEPHSGTLPGVNQFWGSGFIAGYAKPDWDPSVLAPFDCSHFRVVVNEPPSLIRAATSIGYLFIKRMVEANKIVPPLVEAPQIDVLRIGLMDRGVIWSGVRSDCTPTYPNECHQGPTPCACSTDTFFGVRCGADPTDPASYVVLGDAEIEDAWGRIYSGGAPVYDTALFVASFDRLDIEHRLLASLYLLSLDESQNLRIGCSLGLEGNTSTGRLYVSEAGGLHGQITINAHGAAGTNGGGCEAPSGEFQDVGWWHNVDVMADPGPPPIWYKLSRPARDPGTELDYAPYYDRLPLDLGGGAIGQVPFHLHDLACDPPLTEDIEGRTFSNAAFCQLPSTGSGEPYDLASITLDFYGPVRTWPMLPEVPDDEETPISVVSISDTTGYDYARDLDVTVTRGTGGPLSRAVVVKGRPGVLLPVGTYIVKPRRAGAYPMLCDGLFDAAPATPVADFAYLFKLWSDCNRNGVDDTADIAADPVLDIWPHDGRIDDCNQCDGDYTLDGNVDQDDISCFTGLVGGDVTSGCYQGLVNYLAGLGLQDPAGQISTLLDVNNDGNADQDDVSAVINIVGGGGCP
ncbi:MAG: hypothetical protein IT433_00010, partial [Phycisphaerales bacterium]|nr:hypothetical protein [Phycisphaerales bacterium]